MKTEPVDKEWFEIQMLGIQEEGCEIQMHGIEIESLVSAHVSGKEQ